MKNDEAYKILEKYNVKVTAFNEFERKTVHDTGRKNLGLKFRLYAEYLSKEVTKLSKKRILLVQTNTGECPNFEKEREENPLAHNRCSFINIYARVLCQSCRFYQENIKSIDDSIKELGEAAKYFEEQANYDDTWI